MGIKIANFKAIDGAGGMDGYSKQATRVYNRYKNTPDDEFRAIGLAAITRSLSKYTKNRQP